ncbi:MAG: hypothetical protein IPM85_17085 [Chitinophagaceae bacterium]|nr:hypothetical protein [Chitinophagaceae bacterium]
MVFHIGLDSPEMSAMEDLNSFGLKEMSKHRNAELNALTSKKLLNLLNGPKHRLIHYGMLKTETGLNNMKRPMGN